ncbi:MAG: hypothetical protein E6R05_02885 [Candidatus Moraniibacteriota bacterium]|nr:MAG: hypothetical protein E6R05_02885 [Candidatus Moranbacteria bacterium]
MHWSKKQVVWGMIFLIVGLGAWLRVYHLDDWLHFELDQARDVRVIDIALEGDLADLPLLGPRAGGTFLRLGPGFYWLEYLGSLLLGDSVVGSAAMVAFFSILSLPLFYLLARRFFPVPLALGLLGLMAVSTFMVMYGRFAWNPNLVPFFSLLGFYALLRAVDDEESHRGRWLLLSGFALALATHMHFLAFLALPTIAVLLLLIKRPRIALKFWVGAFGIVALLYLPMMLNEIATGGDNAREFVAALTEKSEKEDHPLIEKAVRNVSEFGLHSVVILTGFEGATFPSIILSDGVIGSVCDAKCDRGKWYGVAAIILLGLALLSLTYLWWRETETKKKDLLLLALLWFGVTFVLYLPLSYGIAPRFFLPNAPLFFILLGCFILVLQRLFFSVRLGRALMGGVIGFFIFTNLHFLLARFDELSRAGTEAVVSAPDRILKEPTRVTLEQQKAIADFLARRSQESSLPIYMASESHYERALKYHLDQRGLESDGLGITHIYREGLYFLIIRATSDHTDALEKYLPHYTVGETTSFGTLVAIELVPKQESITAERQDFFAPEKPIRSRVAPRYTLREFLSREEPNKDSDDPAEDVQDE